jgi:hypothetical protein
MSNSVRVILFWLPKRCRKPKPGSGQIPMTLEPFYIVSVIGVSENPACFSYAQCDGSREAALVFVL